MCTIHITSHLERKQNVATLSFVIHECVQGFSVKDSLVMEKIHTSKSIPPFNTE